MPRAASATGCRSTARAAEQLIADAVGPAADDADAEELAIRRARDALVLRHAPGRERTDLRNPAQVRELLAAVGVDVPNTRKWVLEPYRHDAPAGRRAARLAQATSGSPRPTATGGSTRTSGPDDRLRGRWTACDGAAGRMTAAERPAQPARAAAPGGRGRTPGHVFVRADLGQIEPRVLAVVSGDRAFAAATRADDLYAPVGASSSASSGRWPRWRCSPRCTASAAARPARPSRTSSAPTPWRWACSSGAYADGRGAASRCARTAGG